MRYLIFAFLLSLVSLWGQEPLRLSLKRAEELAVENNYQLQASLHRLEQGYYGYRASKDYFLPSIAVGSSFEITKDKRGLEAVLRVTQPLYDPSAYYQLQEAQIQWEQLRLKVQQQICDILFQVREAYDAILLSHAHLALDRMVIDIWKGELNKQERHLKLGASIPYEVKQTNLQLKNAWIEYYATQQKIKKGEIKLLTLLGLAPETLIELVEKDIRALPSNWHTSQADQWKKRALEFRPELKLEQFAFLLSQNQVQQARAESAPVVSLYANAGHRYINNGFDRQPSYGVGINFDWSFYTPANKQKIRQAREGRRGVTYQYYQLELKTIAETYCLLSEIEQAYHAYLTAQEGATLAEEAIQLANKKHEVGSMSPFEYRDAIKALHEAQQRAIEAKFFLRHAYHRLVQHTGTDLASHTICH